MFYRNIHIYWIFQVNHRKITLMHQIYIYIYIIIIMSCRQHRYPWPSLATSPFPSSPLACLQGYILCLHIVAVCRFELVVLLLHSHMWGSIGVHHLYIYIYIYIHGVMDKLTSKLVKNVNNYYISLYQIYLPKLHENILKFYW